MVLSILSALLLFAFIVYIVVPFGTLFLLLLVGSVAPKKPVTQAAKPLPEPRPYPANLYPESPWHK